jgi:hypothetical protein
MRLVPRTWPTGPAALGVVSWYPDISGEPCERRARSRASSSPTWTVYSLSGVVWSVCSFSCGGGEKKKKKFLRREHHRLKHTTQSRGAFVGYLGYLGDHERWWYVGGVGDACFSTGGDDERYTKFFVEAEYPLTTRFCGAPKRSLSVSLSLCLSVSLSLCLCLSGGARRPERRQRRPRVRP